MGRLNSSFWSSLRRRGVLHTARRAWSRHDGRLQRPPTDGWTATRKIWRPLARLLPMALVSYLVAQTGSSNVLTERPSTAIQLGNTDGVNAVALSYDSMLVLTGSINGIVTLWDRATGWELRTFRGHTSNIVFVAFSRDNRFAVSASTDRTVRVWDVRSGAEVHLIGMSYTADRPSSAYGFLYTTFLPGGTELITAARDGEVTVWSTRTWNPVRTMTRSTDSIVGATVSADGQSLVVAYQRGDIGLWDIDKGVLQSQVQVQKPVTADLSEFITCISIADDSKQIAVGVRVPGSETGRVRVYRTSDLMSQYEAELRTPAASVAFQDAGHMIVGEDSGEVTSWTLATKEGGQTLLSPSSKLKWGNSNYKGGELSVSAKDGLLLSGSADGRARLWNLADPSQTKSFEGTTSTPRSMALSANRNLLAVGDANGAIRVWDLESGTIRLMLRIPHDPAYYPVNIVTSLGFSADDKLVIASATGNREHNITWDLGTGRRAPGSVVSANDSVALRDRAFSNTGRFEAFSDDRGLIHVVDHTTKGEMLSLPPPANANWTYTLALADDAKFVLRGLWNGPVQIWNTGQHSSIELEGFDSSAVGDDRKVLQCPAFSPHSLFVAGSIGADPTIYIWNAVNGHVETRLYGHLSTIIALNFLQDDNTVVSASIDGTVRVWSIRDSKEIAMLTGSDTGEWAVNSPLSVFDASTLEQDLGIHWLFQSSPFRPFPPEMFMRQYYEPRLLPRLLTCHRAEPADPDACKNEFKEVPPVASLNRVQPEVQILGVRRGATADEAVVEVEARGKTDLSEPNGKITTAAFDLRLFRDGQLVGQWPEPKGSMSGPADVEAWRKVSPVPTPRHNFPVKLASGDPSKPVKFTAYAFNEDRVKSETTAPWLYTPPADMPKRKSKAYVITVGIDGYENERWDLEFAAKDAQDMSNALRHIKDYEVVPVTLVSEAPLSAGSLNQATKAKIHAVLELLGGHREHLAFLAGVAHVGELAKATPDDLVILSFSGHGYTKRDGAFYLLPSDADPDKDIPPTSLPSFISSEELSEWLRDVDAGQMAMIIDACHSAASVDIPGFKPGPMGDRGLGQLAYDKGMRILAASQADDIALEIENLHQGLLTYALVQEGLRPGEDGKLPADLSGNGQVTLEEWLKYGEQRTPSLYEDIRNGKIKAVAYQTNPDSTAKSRDPKPNPAFLDQVLQHAQTPSLFDFHKENKEVMLTKNNEK